MKFKQATTHILILSVIQRFTVYITGDSTKEESSSKDNFFININPNVKILLFSWVAIQIWLGTAKKMTSKLGLSLSTLVSYKYEYLSFRQNKVRILS